MRQFCRRIASFFISKFNLGKCGIEIRSHSSLTANLHQRFKINSYWNQNKYMADRSQLLRTPLYELAREQKARFTAFSGWEMPVQFSGLTKEHQAVRSAKIYLTQI